MRKMIIANWKMHPPTYKEAEKLIASAEKAANENPNVRVIACPPFTWLTDFSHKPHGRLLFGAQDCGPETKSGPYTGEISPRMLKNSKVKYVILGHSERRAMGETDDLIAKKLAAATKGGLLPILCVGESLQIRKKGRSAVGAWLKMQLDSSMKYVSSSSRLIIAYEPIWAISTNEGMICDPDEANNTIGICKSYFVKGKTDFIYGGSVNHLDAADYLKMENISGLLVGHDSLNPKHFAGIVESVS